MRNEDSIDNLYSISSHWLLNHLLPHTIPAATIMWILVTVSAIDPGLVWSAPCLLTRPHSTAWLRRLRSSFLQHQFIAEAATPDEVTHCHHYYVYFRCSNVDNEVSCHNIVLWNNNKFVQVSILSFDEEVWYWNNSTINTKTRLSMPGTHTCWTCPRPGAMTELPRARRAPSSRPLGCPSRPWWSRELLGLPSGSWADSWHCCRALCQPMANWVAAAALRRAQLASWWNCRLLLPDNAHNTATHF